jgi:signal transduction histidine kinase
VHVSRGDELTPLTRMVTDELVTDEGASGGDELAAQVFESARPRISGRAFAFPLSAGSGPVAVVTGVLSEGLLPDQIGLQSRLEDYAGELAPEAVRLDAALLFAALRDTATSDERRRLAREMHDGVAQDIASMGYLVDGLAAGAESPAQAAQLKLLRETITSVVAEVRRSVLTLRSGVDGTGSLGSAVAGVARHLSALSGVPIKVTVDEGTTRLRPEVEAELMRITQEALNNAVRHAQASQVDVTCQVNPPEVCIVVSDNGRGLQGKRSDSHGLEIMNERARLIGAELEIGDRDGGGVTVSVRISGDSTYGASATLRQKERVPS